MSLHARPATRADIAQWYPETTCSFRAWVCEIDDEPKGIIGISLARPIATLFSTFDEELRPHLRSLTVMRLIKNAQAACRETALPVFAVASPEEATAPGILSRLGFEPFGEVDGDHVWRLS